MMRAASFSGCATCVKKSICVIFAPDRRAFLCWALMLGLVPPERVVERVVAELEEREP